MAHYNSVYYVKSKPYEYFRFPEEKGLDKDSIYIKSADGSSVYSSPGAHAHRALLENFRFR